MKKKAVKRVLVAIALCAVFVLVSILINGINKTIDTTLSVNVYEDDDGTYRNSSVLIHGNLKRTLSSAEFVGTFAIESFEPSCRDGVEAKIAWFDDDYQDITYFYFGDFTRFDIELIEISEQMDSLMIVFGDGTIIATPNHYVPGRIWMQYKGQASP